MGSQLIIAIYLNACNKRTRPIVFEHVTLSLTKYYYTSYTCLDYIQKGNATPLTTIKRRPNISPALNSEAEKLLEPSLLAVVGQRKQSKKGVNAHEQERKKKKKKKKKKKRVESDRSSVIKGGGMPEGRRGVRTRGGSCCAACSFTSA